MDIVVVPFPFTDSRMLRIDVGSAQLMAVVRLKLFAIANRLTARHAGALTVPGK
jgi:hypothetical protein